MCSTGSLTTCSPHPCSVLVATRSSHTSAYSVAQTFLTVSSQTWVTSSVTNSVLHPRATTATGPEARAIGPATDPTTAPPSPGATTISRAPSAMRTLSPDTDLKALPSLSATTVSTSLKVFSSSEAGTKSAMAEARTQQKRATVFILASSRLQWTLVVQRTA